MTRTLLITASLVSLSVPAFAAKPGTLSAIDQRYAKAETDEIPNFRRHVVPLLGRLGCNGRACHGSFQGQGGFRLSLFGYDFKMDHEGLSKRVDTDSPQDSYAIEKPTSKGRHKGGQRYQPGSWEHHVFLKWIGAGAKGYDIVEGDFVGIEVSPPQVVFQADGQSQQLQVTAVWKDGTREDVTPLCRFQANDDQVAKVTQNGKVTAGKPGDTHVVIFYDNGVLPVPVMRPVSGRVGKNYPKVQTPTQVDNLVVGKLRTLGIVPSEVCGDAEFLRRVSLDMTGTLPTSAQVEEFLSDRSPDKRTKKINELLESPAYAAWWTTKLCDYTGNNDFQLRNFLPQYNRNSGSASKAWYDWIYKRVANNTPYDDLVEGLVTATSRIPGQSYTEYCKDMSAMYRSDSKKSFADQDNMVLYWARREFRDAEPRAINFAYAFLGIRIQCAQCHKHPFDQWTREDFAEFTNFFRQVTASNNGRPANRGEQKEYDAIIKALKLDPKLRGNQARRQFGRLVNEGKTVPFSEVYIGSVRRSRNVDRADTAMTHAKLLGGKSFEINRNEDIRKPLMDWLRRPDNPLFAKAFVNRVWASYFHRGIVEPPDDNSLANPPVNKPLLDYLAKGFIESGFDMKWLHRTIAGSHTYQRSWRPNDTNRADETNFSRAVPRRLPAEVAYDAIKQATYSDEQVAAMHANLSGRAIAIPGASSRANNRGATYALQIFGKSIRESSCDCDRSDEPSLLQTVFLQNDNEILTLLSGGQSWVAQIDRQLRPQGANRPGQTNRKPGNYDQQVSRMEKQIQRLKKANNQEAAQKLERRLAAYKRQYAPKKPVPPKEPVKPAKLDTATLVKQAYLRTLSRYPNEEELKKAREYVEGSSDTVSGLRGLMWVLLNTKEFIVNH